MSMKVGKRCIRTEWKSFLDENSAAIFQTALLLTANPQRAESALIASIEGLDFSRQPQDDDLLIWQRAIVKLSIGTPFVPSHGENGSAARPLLQPGLRFVMQVDRLPRICFVLQLLLGYTTDACADFLDLDESEVPVLVAEAVLQLQQMVVPQLRP